MPFVPDTAQGQFVPDITPEEAKKRGILSKVSGAIIGGIIKPPIEFATHAGMAEERTRQMRQGKKPSDINLPDVSYNIPPWMGGPINVKAPTSTLEGARQMGGEAVQTAALAAPGTKGVPLWQAGGRLGMIYGAGEALENAKDPNEAASTIEKGAIGGAVTGGALQGIGRAGRAIAGGELKPYFYPRSKAAEAAEEMSQIRAKVGTEKQGLMEQRSRVQTEADTLRAQKRTGAQLAQSSLTAAQEEWNGKITQAQNTLDEAVQKNIPALKSQVLKLHKGMTTAYGKILDDAVEGKEFLRTDYNEKVIKPVLEMMQADQVPETAPIVKKLNAMLGKAAEEPEPETSAIQGPEGKPIVKPPTEPITPTDTLNARDFKHLSKQITDSMSAAAKDGRLPAGLYDNWAVQFKKLQGKFLEGVAPELAEANKSYSEMAFARGQLWRKTRPFTAADMDGADKLLRDIASGKMSPTTKAVIKLAEEGHGPIPGIGKGEFAKSVAGPGQELAERQRGLKIVSDKIKRDLTIEKNDLTNRIAAQMSKMKELQANYASANKQLEAVRQLDAYRKRLIKIANFEKGLAWTAVGVGVGSGTAVPIARHLMNTP